MLLSHTLHFLHLLKLHHLLLLKLKLKLCWWHLCGLIMLLHVWVVLLRVKTHRSSVWLHHWIMAHLNCVSVMLFINVVVIGKSIILLIVIAMKCLLIHSFRILMNSLPRCLHLPIFLSFTLFRWALIHPSSGLFSLTFSLFH